MDSNEVAGASVPLKGARTLDGELGVSWTVDPETSVAEVVLQHGGRVRTLTLDVRRRIQEFALEVGNPGGGGRLSGLVELQATAEGESLQIVLKLSRARLRMAELARWTRPPLPQAAATIGGGGAPSTGAPSESAPRPRMRRGREGRKRDAEIPDDSEGGK